MINLIDKLILFLNGLATVVLISFVALVIARVAAGYSNLNFFGWTFVTLRRLADPFLGRVRRALIGFRIDPKIAPLVTILIALLLWWVVTAVASTTLSTIADLLLALQQRVMARVIGHLLIGLLRLYTLLIFMRIVCSWIMMSYANRLMRFLINTTEPLLGPLRRMIPPAGMFDVSALIALLILLVLEMVVRGTFLR